MREVFKTEEFNDFINQLDKKTIDKFEQVIAVITYEMRVSVGNNQYRTIIFSINNNNIINATKIVLIHGFLKKGTKQYNKEIKRAETILNDYDYENN